MAGTTPNRGYPYPTSGDSFDVPRDIQALAEAIDLDMQNLDTSLVQRPIAVVSSRSTTPQIFPADQVTEARFDFVFIDTAGISNLTNFPTRLTPTSAGLWMVWGELEVPNAQSEIQDLFLRFNGGDLTRQMFHVNSALGPKMLVASAMAFCDGIDDYFTMTFEPDGGLDDYRISIKRMGCLRLTNT
jgi:hypothetical protein